MHTNRSWGQVLDFGGHVMHVMVHVMVLWGQVLNLGNQGTVMGSALSWE